VGQDGQEENFQFLDKDGYYSLPYHSRWEGDYIMKC